MKLIPHTLILSALLSLITLAEPILESWYEDSSRHYARVYTSDADALAKNTSTTWNRGVGVQTQPAYAGVYEINYDASDIYITSSGLGAHIMGPWIAGFPNFPQNRGATYRIPRTPTITDTKTNTGGGTIGLFVDGVSMFDSRDSFSWDAASQSNQPMNNGGDQIWNSDAYVNESVTFDPAFAHQAGSNYHYHANPPGLRHLLGDNVTYDPENHIYTEGSSPSSHSPILGWASDGLPLYGPYGYIDPLDPSSGVHRMRSGFRLRTISDRSALPAWAARSQGKPTPLSNSEQGPTLAQIPLGHYLEDNEYLGDVGFTLGEDFDLNEYNCRWCITPDFPSGTWAYFVNIEIDGTPKFPYNLSRQFYGVPNGSTVTTLPTNLTNSFRGGPSSAAKDMQVTEQNILNGDITLTWTGTEGATYEVASSTDLQTWQPMREVDQAAFTDIGAALTRPKTFYRAKVEDIQAYDITGLTGHPTPRTGLESFLVTLSGNNIPSDLSILPNTVLFHGEAVTVIARPSINEIIIQAQTSDLTEGTYPLEVTFPQNSTSSTGSYTKLGESNILLVIVDDWGIDSSPIDNLGAPNLPAMPNFTALAAQGIHFTHAYAHAACSTTRASIITGRYPYRTGVGSPGGATLLESETTIADALSSNTSYGLGSIGKWHLGGGNDGPAKAGGWPYYYGSLSSGVADYYNWQRYDVSGAAVTVNSTTFGTPYATTVTTDDALTFIQAQGSNPWLCWVGYNAPHAPMHDPPTSINGVTNPIPAGGTTRDKYEAMLWAFDTELGRLLDGVDLTETTVIIIGDNGTPANVIQPPYTSDHSKTTIYEGGTRVPLIIAGAAVSQPGVSDALVHCSDLYPTMLELAGVTPSSLGVELDGVSLIPILTDSDVADRITSAEAFGNNITSPGRAIRYGDYKLIIRDDPTSNSDTASFEFYHIPSDTNEETNLLDDLINSPLSTTEQAAFDLMIVKNTELGGPYHSNDTLVTIYASLDPSAISPRVPNLTRGTAGNPVTPSSITVGGIPANFVARQNAAGAADQYTVELTINPSLLNTGNHEIIVTFNGNPSPRVFTATNQYSAP